MPAGTRSSVNTSGAVSSWASEQAASLSSGQGEVISASTPSWALPEVSVAVTTRPRGSVRVMAKMRSLPSPVLVLHAALYWFCAAARSTETVATVPPSNLTGMA